MATEAMVPPVVTTLLGVVLTGLLSYASWKLRQFVKNQENQDEILAKQDEILDKHNFILFGDDDIAGYAGLQVVAYENRQYLKQHHRALVDEGLISEDKPAPNGGAEPRQHQ